MSEVGLARVGHDLFLTVGVAILAQACGSSFVVWSQFQLWPVSERDFTFLQVIRGPRPLSTGQQVRQPAQQSQPSMQVLSQILVKTSGTRPLVDPSVKILPRRNMLNLETALATMEGMEGLEVESVSPGALLNIQMKECESFLSSATSHLEELDTKRATISGRRGRSAAFTRVGVSIASTDLLVPAESQSGQPTNQKSQFSEGFICRREDVVPQCDEEMEEWMAGRHADLQTALASGQLPEVARVSHLMTNAAQEWRQLTTPSFIGGEHIEVMRTSRFTARVLHVGEVTNERRSSSPLIEMHVDGSSPADSDDEPLIAPSVPATIPAVGMLPTWVHESPVRRLGTLDGHGRLWPNRLWPN